MIRPGPSASKSRRRCHLAAGFAISSLVHLTLLAAVLASHSDAPPASANAGTPLEPVLAMFADLPMEDREPAAQVAETEPEVAQPEVSPPTGGAADAGAPRGADASRRAGAGAARTTEGPAQAKAQAKTKAGRGSRSAAT
jgi:hypothetical protein